MCVADVRYYGGKKRTHVKNNVKTSGDAQAQNLCDSKTKLRMF